MADNYSVVLPIPTGSIACTLKAPKLGLIKQFRKLSRESVDATKRYNSALQLWSDIGQQLADAEARGVVPAELMQQHDALEAKLESLDDASYGVAAQQATLVLNLFQVRNAAGVVVTDSQATLADVAWDEVELSTITEIAGFFSKSISG